MEQEAKEKEDDIKPADADDNIEEAREKKKLGMLYTVEDVPPWYLCGFLGFQHFLTMVGGTISAPFVLAPALCMVADDPARGYLLSTILFVNGIVTVLQSTFGVRLPIIQGGTFALVVPIMAILHLPQWQCPDNLEELSPDIRTEMWQVRIKEIQGALIVASLLEVSLGAFGIIGAALRYITPLTIAPAITMIGISLFPVVGKMLAKDWIISISTLVLLTLLSQHFHQVTIPTCVRKHRFPLFKLFPVLLSILIMWGVCAILTVSGVLAENSASRTDVKSKLVESSPWFRFPYPGEWGAPTVSVGAVFGLMAGLIASAIESIGDYYACARIAGAVAPPTHALNRGIMTEGIGCFIAGLWGSINGTTSFGENIGAIGVTKVGSRRVVQVAGVLMIIAGSFSKLGALFVTIPEPIVGGVFCVMFGIVTAVGVSNLQFVDLNSSRNLFVFGVSIFVALVIPQWMKDNRDVIRTGNDEVDQVVSVLLSTGMFLAGFSGFVLDNTIPGTDKERGLITWQSQGEGDTAEEKACYDFPYGMEYLRRHKWTSYLPFSPTFNGWNIHPCCPYRKVHSENVPV